MADKKLPTEDEQLLESPPPQRPEQLFQKSDSWRVLRIMGEFVWGFDNLADVSDGVTIFGSARTLPGRSALREGGADRDAAGAGRHSGAHRRRPRDHGGRQPRREGGWGPLDRVQHRAAVRAGLEPRT